MEQLQRNFGIPVILVASGSDPALVEAAMQARANGLMARPLQADDLKSALPMAFYHHRMSRKVRESEERYGLAIRASKDGIWDWNLKTNKVYYSAHWNEMLGFKEAEIGTHINDWLRRIHPEDRKQVQAKLASHLQGSTPYLEFEYRIQCADGEFLWMLCRGLAEHDPGGNIARMAGLQSDISARKAAEEGLAHNAVHDALTGLPNRLLFLDRLQNRLDRTRRNPNDLFAVMFIDLDRFKVVRDSLGHAFGDQLLVTPGWRLQQCLRSEDSVSRFAAFFDGSFGKFDQFVIECAVDAMILLDGLMGLHIRTRFYSRRQQQA